MSDRADTPGADILAQRPAIARRWEVGDDGMVRVMVPRFTGRLLGRFLMPRLKKPYMPLKLDEIGSFVWPLCDGTRTGDELAGLLAERFEKMDDARVRLAQFLSVLFAQGHVR